MEEPPQPAGAELSVDQVAGVERRSPSIEKTHTTTPNSPTTALVEKPSHIIEVATKASAPTISTLPLAAPSPTSAPMSNVTTAESQPMTAASSTSSSIPNIQQSVANEGVGSSPYGTRSRNRNGNNRPNYAEDREQDGEYEWTTTKKTQNASTASNSAHASENDKATTSGRRRSIQGAAGSTSRTNGAGTTASKDYIPGMSSFSVNSDPNGTSQPHSKKRKAPGSHATPSHSLGQSSTSTATRHRTSSRDRRETNMLTFETSQGYLKHGKLTADDGTRLAANDHVYLVCEPPGEPYYIARIMEFVHMENDITRPVESLRVNWVYRPRDIQRKGNDTRLVYATMHSDVSSLQSLRGKCQVQHKDKIPALDEYKKVKNCFYFHQMFDRYMRRCYDVIPTEQVVNVPERVKRVLDERWKYVIVESGRGKELTGAIKSCKRCSGYCASHDSVDCAMCKNTYHMTCVRPPLLKKPARGFAWSCGPCSRKQERKLEARNTPLVGERAVEGEEEEYLDEEDEEHAGVTNPINSSSPGNHDTSNGVQPATAEQIAQAKLWPFRYLGIHCKVEDVLDYDDRIYPRAISRLGPRHQANVINWHGRPLEYVKPAEMKRKYMKGSIQKKEVKIPKDTVAALEADKLAKEKRPKWVVDEPAGFVHRGGDHQNSDIANTAKICFRLPQVGEASSRGGDEAMLIRHEPRQLEQIIDDYMIRARSFAPSLGLKEHSTNFLDKALQYLYNNNFDPEAAFTQLQAVDLRKDLKEPKLSKEELKRFEEGIAKYGTNLHEVSKHVGKPPKNGEIVRFYYMWKKTDRGKQIWGNFEGRKPKKSARVLDSALVDDVADDVDDSAFDNDKATARKRGFECKFCWTRQSRLWRRAPGTAPGTTVLAESGSKGNKDKAVHLMVALCERCAGLWRRYAIQWESVDELAKKVAQSGGRAWKRKMDSELLEELFNANQASAVATSSTAVAAAASVGIHVPQTMTVQPEQEAVRKKLKTGSEKDSPQQNIHSVPPEPPKKKVVEKPPEPPLVPDPPKIKVLPCFICKEMEPSGEEHFCCRYCRLTVHRNCYGISEERSVNKWTCDMCFNDVNCLTSTSYECRLCPVQYNDYELMEPPKASHKKKTDREREKERLEKELVVEATTQYQRRQEETGRPVCPREPLKKTSGNNWVHVVCAVWTSLIKFGNAKLLEPAEGLGSIPQSRYGQTCKICKTSGGVCITCHKCPATFHVGCAHQYGYPMGFDVTPVKSSRKDVVNTVTLGNETGNVEAVIYCKDHPVKTILHPMHELVEDSGLNALQLFVRNFKQADLALTGTVRKAAIINSSVRAPQATSINGHRPSISNIAWVADGSSSLVPTTRSSRASPTAVTVKSEEVDEDGDRVVHLNESICMESFTKECVSCGTEISPKWHLKGLLKISSTEISSVDVKPTMAHPQQESSDSNGLTCTSTVNHGTFHVFNKTSDSAETASVPNGHALITQDQPKNAVLSATVNGTIHPTTTTTIKSLGPAESVPDYLCHRCYLKKLRDPTPLVSVTEPVQPLETVPPPPEEIPAVETRAASPAPWPPVSTPLPSRPESWPIQSQPQLASTIRTSNGVDHSSSFVATHVQQPYVPSPQQPPSQPHYHMNGYEHREQHHGPPVQLSMNGAPPPYHLSRNIPPPPQQAAYPVQGPGHAGVPYGRSNANGTRSPPVHYRIAQAPPGPPRAAENPFEMPHHSRDSPRQHYYGPRAEDRPATPSEANSRNGGWGGGEGPVANGASASPSLRNLLH